MDLIAANGGGDRLVESKRKKLFRGLLEEAEINKEVLDEKASEVDTINAEEADELTMMGAELAHELRRVFY